MEIKRTVSLLTMVLIGLLLVGCGTKQTAGISDTDNFSESIKQSFNNSNSNNADYNTATRDISAILRKVNINDYEKTEDVISSNDYDISSDLNVMEKNSDEVVEGTIKEVTYVVIDGDGWTKVDLDINTSIKGNLRAGDMVSVYQLGGYVPLADHIKFYDDAFRYSDLSDNEINNTVLKETVDGEQLPKVGEKAIYFLEKFSNNSILDGQFGRTRGQSSELKYSENGKYIYYRDENETKREVSLNNIKKLSQQNQ